MAKKSKLTKAEYDALSDEGKEFYRADGEAYVLDTDDARELRAAKEREKLRADRAETRTNELSDQLEALQQRLDEAERKRTEKDNDIPALNASWQQKLDAAAKKATDTIENLKRQFRQLLVHSQAEAIAAEISDSPRLILPHIEQQLDVDFTGDMPRAVVLDPVTRKPSAMTVEEMKKSFVDNPDFASIIRGSSASGGGAEGTGSPSSKSRGGGASKKLSEMSENERKAFAKQNPEAFRNQAKSEGFGRFN